MCKRHRCTTWGGNKCASRFYFDEPHEGPPAGRDCRACLCACCGFQCKRGRFCSIDPDDYTALAETAPAAVAVSSAVLAGDGRLGVKGVRAVAGVLAAGAVFVLLRRRRPRARALAGTSVEGRREAADAHSTGAIY